MTYATRAAARKRVATFNRRAWPGLETECRRGLLDLAASDGRVRLLPGHALDSGWKIVPGMPLSLIVVRDLGTARGAVGPTGWQSADNLRSWARFVAVVDGSAGLQEFSQILRGVRCGRRGVLIETAPWFVLPWAGAMWRPRSQIYIGQSRASFSPGGEA